MTAAPKIAETQIYLYHRPGAVQTEIFIGHLGSKRMTRIGRPLSVANRILGGGSDARFFDNLREDKAGHMARTVRFQPRKRLRHFYGKCGGENRGDR